MLVVGTARTSRPQSHGVGNFVIVPSEDTIGLLRVFFFERVCMYEPSLQTVRTNREETAAAHGSALQGLHYHLYQLQLTIADESRVIV
jgi:hypothetical protein